MGLCEPCSTIDFGSCFPGRPNTGLIVAHRLRNVQHVVNTKEDCSMCLLIFEAIEQNYPHLLQPENGKDICGWSEKDGGEPGTKLLVIQAGSHFLNFNWIQDAEIPPTPGRTRDLKDSKPGSAQPKSLLQDWLRICKDAHTQCQHVWSNKTVMDLKLRFIEVKKWCLVSTEGLAESDCRYAALSYVWGTKTTVTTDASNLAQFSREGQLRSANLRATIEDAIRLVDAMGVPYLWVDALCIVQRGGDSAEKALQIENMDSVYGLAEFTVVQATGDDSSSPLLGFEGSHPPHKDGPRQIQGLVKPGLRLALQFSGFDDRQKRASKWITRAWTFQEAVLSPRMLLWHNGSVTWECREAVWCEDTVPGSASSFLKPQFGSQMLPFEHERLKAEEEALAKLLIIEPRGRHDNISMYEGAVQEYTSREMSFWSDKLNAFGGIKAVFERQMNTKLLYGLPRDQLDTALLWSAVEAGSLERLPEFPSWSWAGWKGAVRYGSQNPLLLAPSPAFYVVSEDEVVSPPPKDGSLRLKRMTQAWEAEGYVAPARPWSIAPGVAPENTPHVQHPSTQNMPSSVDLSHCLCFKAYCTSASHFKFQGHKLIDTKSEKIVGGVLLDVEPLPADLSRLEIVMMAHCSASSFEMARKDDQVEYFPDGIMPHPNFPELRTIQGKAAVRRPLDCCRFLVVEKGNDGKSVRIGLGEMSQAALNRVGVQRRWVFLS